MNGATPQVESKPLSPTVRALGLVSFLTDLSSEMVYPINPIFLTAVLGAPAWFVGVVEGIAESAASLLKIYSGWLSDRSGRRKPLTIVGYSLGAIAKPLVGLSTVWLEVLAARFLDRVGKGLRSAPRDALITESCAPGQKGRAFGLHRSMDTAGAVLGPLLGYCFLQRLNPDYLGQHPNILRNLYWIAFVPGLLSVIALWIFVKEKPRRSGEESANRPSFPTWKSLSSPYRRYLLILALFSIGNSSDAFLLLKAKTMGVTVQNLLLLYAAFNVLEVCLGYSAGKLSDTVGRRPLIVVGYLAFALVYLGFGLLNGATAAWVLFLAYGVYYTLTQGVQRAYAADLAQPSRRATEIGAFHMLVGVFALPASLLAGQLYSHVSTSAPFLLGAATATISAVLLLMSPRGHSHSAAPR